MKKQTATSSRGKATPAKGAAKKTVTRAAKTPKSEKELEQAMVNALLNSEPKTTKTRKTAKAKKPASRAAADSLELAIQVAQGMFEKKAEDIRILDMRLVKGASADFFVLSHAESDKQVEAIANSVEDEVVKHSNEWPRHREGFTNLEWVLLDYFDVVAHVFQREKRDFYGVEELWGDAIEIPFEGK